MDVILEHLGKAKICHEQLRVIVLAPEQQILGFEVAVDDALGVKVADRVGDGPDQLGRVRLVEVLFRADPVKQLAAEAQVGHDVERGSRLSIVTGWQGRGWRVTREARVTQVAKGGRWWATVSARRVGKPLVAGGKPRLFSYLEVINQLDDVWVALRDLFEDPDLVDDDLPSAERLSASRRATGPSPSRSIWDGRGSLSPSLPSASC